MPFTQRGTGSPQGNSRRYMRSSPTRTQTWRSTSKTWLLLAKMIFDVVAYAKWCYACQIHSDFIHQALGHLHPTSSSWPFEMWEIDVIGPITPSNIQRISIYSSNNRLLFKLGENYPLKKVKMSAWSSSSSIIFYIALACHDESSTIMDPSSSAKHSRDSVINAESKVCLQQHTIQLLTALQKHSTRPSTNFSRSLSQKANVTGMRS